MLATRLVLLRGKYNPTAKIRKYPNLQRVKVGKKRMLICTGCMRTLRKAK